MYYNVLLYIYICFCHGNWRHSCVELLLYYSAMLLCLWPGTAKMLALADQTQDQKPWRKKSMSMLNYDFFGAAPSCGLDSNSAEDHYYIVNKL